MVFIRNPDSIFAEQGADVLLINSIAGRNSIGPSAAAAMQALGAPPRVASNVAFFNRTAPALRLLEAWAEAMAFKLNALAVDDATLDVLLNLGGWLQRAKIGWLTIDECACVLGASSCTSAVLLHNLTSKSGQHVARARVIPVLPPRS